VIYIIDDFLENNLLESLKKELIDFKQVDTPGKSFWVKPAHEDFIRHVLDKLEVIEGKSLKNILGFFREANVNQDNEWRIHNDSKSGVYKEQPNRALVLFMSDNKENGLNGTAFWEHKKYGDKFPKNSTTKEADRMLKNEANDLSRWNLRSIVGHKKNRLVSYPCSYFHSKYPNEFKQSRVVFVMFYK
jgi:hypothetical protein